MDFNEIKNIWKNSFETERLSDVQIKAKLKINNKSNIILNKVINNYKYSIVALLIIYIIADFCLFLFVKISVAFLLFSFASVFTGLAFFITYRNLRKIQKTVISDDDVITTINNTVYIMEKSLRFGMGNIYKYLLIPSALIIGIAVGIYIGSGENSFIYTIQNLETKSIIKIIVIIIGGTIITIWFSQSTMKRMYKNKLDELKKYLVELNEINKL